MGLNLLACQRVNGMDATIEYNCADHVLGSGNEDFAYCS